MLQRSNLKLGSGGCAAVYLGRIVHNDSPDRPHHHQHHHCHPQHPTALAGGGPLAGSSATVVSSNSPGSSRARTPSLAVAAFAAPRLGDGLSERPATASPGVSSITSADQPHLAAHQGGTDGPPSATRSNTASEPAEQSSTAAGTPVGHTSLVAVKVKFIARGRHAPSHSWCVSPAGGRADAAPAGMPGAASSSGELEPEHSLMLSLPLHRNVMHVIASFTAHDGHTNFAMPLMDSDVAHEIRRHNLKPTEAQSLALVRDTLEALVHVHGHDMAHRDVKPSNLLIKRDATRGLGVRVVLSDFGVAHRMDPESLRLTSRVAGTHTYQAPEQLRGGDAFDKQHARACDVWAAGCLMFELLTGQMAFPGDSAISVLNELHRWMGASFDSAPDASARPPLETRLGLGVSDQAKDLLFSLLTFDARARPSACDLLQHPALRNVDRRAELSTDGVPLLIHGYKALPTDLAGVRFISVHDHAIDLSDFTMPPSTGRRSGCGRSLGGGGGGGLFGAGFSDDSSMMLHNSGDRLARTLEERLDFGSAVGGGASNARGVPVADGKRLTLSNVHVTAQWEAGAWSTGRRLAFNSPAPGHLGGGGGGGGLPSYPLAARCAASANSNDEAHVPSGRERSTSCAPGSSGGAGPHLGMPRAHSALSLSSHNCSPIAMAAARSPQRRALFLDSDEESPQRSRQRHRVEGV